uniref:Uncharacterized protein n=1 Tax=Glossina pallidipes TaxID=7398 RepID=A0A1A9ZAA8_GLOPL
MKSFSFDLKKVAFKNLEIHLAKRADRDALSPGRHNDDLLGTPDTKRNGRITRNARRALTSTPCINVDRDELTAAAPAPAPPPATVPLTVSGMFGVSPPMESAKKRVDL